MAETEKEVMMLTAEELVMVLVGGDGGEGEVDSSDMGGGAQEMKRFVSPHYLPSAAQPGGLQAHLDGGEGISDGEDAGIGCGGGFDCFCY
jgi:hypothetical protein